MHDEIESFRNGIFALRTRRFGTVAELMIEGLFGLSKSHNQFHDRFDEDARKRIEIKFSTVMKADKATIKKHNVIEQCLEADPSKRAICSVDAMKYPFDCNIQQVKPAEFDELYYGLFFTDRIAIFRMTSDEVKHCPGFSNRQHKGNLGEGQFHLKQTTLDYHMNNHFVRWLTYEELYDLFLQMR